MAFNMCHFINMKDKKVFLLNHSNIDDITHSRVKEFCYKRLNHEMIHLCYEDYIGRYIEKIYRKKWRFIRHNVNDYKLNYRKNHVSAEIAGFFENTGHIHVIFPGEMFFEEKIIQEIRSLDKSAYLKDKKIKIFIKNKKSTDQTDNVLIYSKYLNDDEYNFIFDSCDYVGIIYNPASYVYRSSGIFFDAVTFKKPIIYCKNMFFDEKVRQFGDIGLEYLNSMKGCFDSISQASYDIERKNMESVYQYYSNKNLLDDLRKIIESE